jgi:hypothetical protein
LVAGKSDLWLLSCGFTSFRVQLGVEKRTQNPPAAAPRADRAVGRIGVAYRATSELKLNARNPRVHSQRQIRQIARSIEAFGFNVPILVNRDLQVIAGHGRVLAARQLGLERVPNDSSI